MRTSQMFVRVVAGLLGLSLVTAACAQPAPQPQTVEVTQVTRTETRATTAVVEKEHSVPSPAATSAPAASEALAAAPAGAPADMQRRGGTTGGDSEPNDEPYGDTFYKHYGVNPFIDTAEDPLSTFAVDVDTGSYTIMRRYLSDGYLPPADAVRVEEYINFFDQGYEPPTEGTFRIQMDGAPSPFGESERYFLLRVGLKGREISIADRKDANLVFVIDVSGSMDMENRLGTVKEALRMLVEQLRPTDRVAIVVYGSQGRVLLQPTGGENREQLLAAIDRLVPEGATNAEEGLKLGYELANQMFDPTRINALILCSDGVANVGNTGPESVLKSVKANAAKGISLNTVGFGMGNYKKSPTLVIT